MRRTSGAMWAAATDWREKVGAFSTKMVGVSVKSIRTTVYVQLSSAITHGMHVLVLVVKRKICKSARQTNTFN